MIPDSVRTLVESGPLAHMTTLNKDGSPQVTVVWIGIENGEFVIAHMHEHQKVRNIRRDGRVALSFLGKGMNPAGLHEYVTVYGKARITEGGAADLLQKLARIYIAPDAVFPPPALREKPGVITRITPERFTGIGPWAAK